MTRAMARLPLRTADAVIVAGLVVLTLAAFARIAGHDYVEYDDQDYVQDNRRVQQGLSAETIAWAFRGPHSYNWHPLTTLTHALDCQAFGVERPGAQHVVSLAWHVATVVLAYFVFRSLVGGRWTAALIAALAAIHPVNVESVAWIAERKNVVSLFFWMATLAAWLWYVGRPGLLHYLAAAALFALGLMSKQMLVTLPCVLLLLDYWPLGRTPWLLPSALPLPSGEGRGEGAPRSTPMAQPARYTVAWLILEKLPLLALSAGASWLVLAMQGHRQASLETLSLAARLQNAVIAYVAYLGKLVWPAGLSVYYPHPGDELRPRALVAAVIVLVAITLVAIKLRHTRPYLIVGWLWYLGTLVPVIGLVQVGTQGMADRYLYGPALGIDLAVACALRDVVAWRPQWRPLLAAGCAASVAALAVVAYVQAGHWQNTVTLFTHAEQVDPENHVALHLLGEALVDQGRIDDGIARLQRAITLRPAEPRPHFSLGYAYYKQARYREALDEYNAGLALNDTLAYAFNGRGSVWLALGDVPAALADFQRGAARDPGDLNIRHNLAVAAGLLALAQGRYPAAVTSLETALQMEPRDAPILVYLGLAQASAGRPTEAATAYRRALEVDPGHLGAIINLANLLATAADPAVRDPQEAVRVAEHAASLTRFASAQVLNTLAAAYDAAGRRDDARGALERALALRDVPSDLRLQLEANLAALKSRQDP